MAGTRRTCRTAGCSRQFTPRRGTRRVYCYECRPEKSAVGVESMSAAPVEPESRVDGPMAAAVRVELERAGQAGTVPGAIALRLAATLDLPGLKPAEVSSLSDKLLKVMEPFARMGAQVPDEVDDFTRRLEEKRATA